MLTTLSLLQLLGFGLLTNGVIIKTPEVEFATEKKPIL